MEDSDITALSNGNAETALKVLQIFNKKNSQTFSFTELNKENKRKRLWEAIFLRLNNPSSEECYIDCLICLRLLSRDKTNLNDIIQEKWISSILFLSGLFPVDETTKNNNTPAKYHVIIAAQKCLSNLLFNSECVQAWCASEKSWCLPALVHRLRDHPHLPHELCLFDLKLLFLLTALCGETRAKVRNEMKGMKYLTEALENLLPAPEASNDASIKLNEDRCVLVCELLKILFNLVDGSQNQPSDEEEEAQFLRLVPVLQFLLICKTSQQEDLRSHCVHLLMAVPPSCYSEFMPILLEQEGEVPKYDTRAVDVLLEMLEQRLKGLSPEASASQQAMEQLCPLLQILGGGTLVHRKLRKYVRSQILPPLQEVHKRPEEVDTLRGALCRLLTCPVSPVRDLVADLLFVLCKESVSRMVKHTGYGNCAGLLANRGLMLGGRGDRGHYSSESEDSDTEEYKEHRDQINPVIGCCEPPRHNPLANMSEEQKEHEAMQIVNMLDKLTRTGVVLPGRIGEDGKPEPLNHVLQLQECLSNVPSNLGGDQSDSD